MTTRELPTIGSTVTATEPKGFGQYPPDFPAELHTTLRVEGYWSYDHPRTGQPVQHVTGMVMDCNYANEVGRTRNVLVDYLDA